MAGSALSAIMIIFALTIAGATVDCDTNNCCCPNGSVTALQADTIVTFSYNVVSKSGCPGRVSVECELSDDECEADNSVEFEAKKSGGVVTVFFKDNVNCGFELHCARDTCKNTDDWTGQYAESGSRGVVVSVACLLTAVLSGMLL